MVCKAGKFLLSARCNFVCNSMHTTTQMFQFRAAEGFKCSLHRMRRKDYTMKQLYRKQTKLSIRHKINKKFNSTSAFITDIVQVVPTNLNNCTVQGPSMCVRVAEWIKVFNHMSKYQTWNKGTSWHRDRFYSSWLCFWCVIIRVTVTVRCHLVSVLQLRKQPTDENLARSLMVVPPF